MKLQLEDDGTWSVITDDGEVLASGLTNAGAWRVVDDAADERELRRDEAQRRYSREMT